eukprot:gene5202-10412_t
MFLMILIAINLVHLGSGFASWFIKDYCGRAMTVGQVIMNSRVVESNERFVQVFRGDVELHTHDSYISGEELLVTLSDTSAQFVFEVVNGAFQPGGCDGRRSDKKLSKLIVPDNHHDDIIIWAGWALDHSVVSITDKFVLHESTESTNGHGKEHEVSEHVEQEEESHEEEHEADNEGDKESGEQVQSHSQVEDDDRNKDDSKDGKEEEQGKHSGSGSGSGSNKGSLHRHYRAVSDKASSVLETSRLGVQSSAKKLGAYLRGDKAEEEEEEGWNMYGLALSVSILFILVVALIYLFYMCTKRPFSKQE